jgi:hypothetical protein
VPVSLVRVRVTAALGEVRGRARLFAGHGARQARAQESPRLRSVALPVGAGA